ncbi:MAG: histidine phosphatase family protein [Eubacteriales bacterium]
MKLYIVRHGETPWNIEKRMQGREDIALNEFGCSLAVKTGKGLSDIRFARAYSSPLIRAYHTAELILKENPLSQEAEIIKDDDLIEMSFGIYEGLCCSKEGWNMPDDNFKNFFSNPGAYHTPEGGESFQSMLDRIEHFLHRILNDPTLENETILIASHGAAIRGIINVITGNTIEEYWKGGVHKNCGITIVNKKNDWFVIEEENIVYYDDDVADW